MDVKIKQRIGVALMKKKIIMSILSAMIVAGLVIVGVLIWRGEARSLVSGGAITPKSMTLQSSEFADWVLEVDESVVLRSADQDFVSVTVYENQSHQYDITHQNNVVSVKKRLNTNNMFFNMDAVLAPELSRVEVVVPRDWVSNVHIKATQSDVTISDVRGLGDWTITIGSAHVLLQNATVDGALRVASDSGLVQLDKTAVDGPIAVQVASGSLQATEVRAQEIKATAYSGSIHLSKTQAEGPLMASVQSGDIRLDRVTSQHSLSLTADSGSIQALLLGSEAQYIRSATDALLEKTDKILLYTEVSNGETTIQFETP